MPPRSTTSHEKAVTSAAFCRASFTIPALTRSQRRTAQFSTQWALSPGSRAGSIGLQTTAAARMEGQPENRQADQQIRAEDACGCSCSVPTNRRSAAAPALHHDADVPCRYWSKKHDLRCFAPNSTTGTTQHTWHTWIRPM